MMKSSLMLIVLAATALIAQPPMRGGGPRPTREPRPTGALGGGPSFEKAAGYFGLSEAQLQSLAEIHASEREALEPLMSKLHEAEESDDPQVVQELRQKVDAQRAPFQAKAQAVLNADQKAKLAALQAAAALAPAMHESAMLSLMAPPARPARGPQGPPPVE